MARLNNMSAIEALAAYLDTLRDLQYTPEEVKAALLYFVGPASAWVTAAPQEGVHPNAKTWPERIWLQGFPDFDEPQPYSAEQDAEATWCADHINSSDVEYIRADLRAPESPQPLAPPPGWADYKERCQHGVRWENICSGCGRSPAPPPLSPPDTGNVGATWSCSRCGAKSVQACNENGCFLGENEPQPVAWIVHTKEGDLLVDYPAERYGSTNPRTPLYAALPPPGRGMVPMTEEQKDKVYNDWRDKGDDVSYDDLMTAVEQFHGIKEPS